MLVRSAVMSGVLLLALGLTTAALDGPVASSPSEAEPAAESTGSPSYTSLASAVCASSSPACEDTYLYAADGTCTTNTGRACIEARADAALRRWFTGRDGGGTPHGVRLLEVVDDRTLIVGYAFGMGPELTGTSVTERPDHVFVQLQFAAPRSPATADPDAGRFPALVAGRAVVELDAPLGDRALDTVASFTPPHGPP